jgi:DNA-binding response OmpR family regulator
MSDRDEALRKAEETMRRLQHEVRTPLGQIKGYSEMIEEELEDYGAEDLAPDLQKIRLAAERLLDLMDGKLQTDAGAPKLSDPEPAPEAHDDRDEAEEDAAASEQAGARMLVVDDDPNNRDILVRRLQKHGFVVDTAANGIGGLRKIETGAFDLVVLDVMMPGMTGLEVLERVRRTRSMSELPIILATALDSSKDAIEGLELGANDYVTKPLDFPVLIARIETHLSAHRAAREVAGLAKQLEFRNTFIREALGRDVAEDLLIEMSERPDSVELSGEMRQVTSLVADLKGTRELSRRVSPAEHHQLLNSVLSGLAELVAHYEGSVDSMPGDAIVAIFGLPVAEEDDAARAVACGVAMQLELDEINARNARVQLPPVQIGVGIASGEVLAGGYGRGDKLRFKAIGEPIVLAAAIEKGSRAGEVWICDGTARSVADLAETDCSRTVHHGSEHPAHRVLGVGGPHLISLREVPPPPGD